jgi:hypothetical protein
MDKKTYRTGASLKEKKEGRSTPSSHEYRPEKG